MLNDYGNLRAIWDDVALPVTWQKWHSTRPITAGIWFSNPGEMQGWVDLIKHVWLWPLQPLIGPWSLQS